MKRSVLLLSLLSLSCSAPPTISPEGRAKIIEHGASLEACAAWGRATHSFEAYEACTRDGGLR